MAEVEKFSLHRQMRSLVLAQPIISFNSFRCYTRMMAAVSVVTRSVGGVYAGIDGCYGDRFYRVTHVEEVLT